MIFNMNIEFDEFVQLVYLFILQLLISIFICV